jgi:hypothetical protein
VSKIQCPRSSVQGPVSKVQCPRSRVQSPKYRSGSMVQFPYPRVQFQFQFQFQVQIGSDWGTATARRRRVRREAIRCRRWLISAMPTGVRACRILQRPTRPDRERLGNGNREKKKGSKRSDPVSTVVDLCNANGSQGLQNPPETDDTRQGDIGER